MITHSCVSHLTNCMRPIVCLHPTCIQSPTHQPVLHCFVIAVCSCWCRGVKLYWRWTFFWWSYQSLSVVVSQSYSIGTWYICLSCKISVYQVFYWVWQLYAMYLIHSMRDKLYYPVLRRKKKNTCVYILYSWVKKRSYGTLEVMIYSFCAWFCLHSLWQSEGSHTLVLFACLLISFPLPLADKKGGLSALYTSPNIGFFPPLLLVK